MAIIWEPYFLALLWADLVLCAYALLITWRTPAGLADTVWLS